MALATFPCEDTMPDDTDSASPFASSGGDASGYGPQDGNRPVVLYDLQLFMNEIRAQIKTVVRELSDSNEQRKSYEVKVDSNAAEIIRLRDELAEERGRQRNNWHDMNNVMQVLLTRMTDEEAHYLRELRKAAEARAEIQQQVTVGRRLQTIVIPGAVVIFIIDQIVTQLSRWHP